MSFLHIFLSLHRKEKANNQLMQQNGRRRVVSVDTESNILDSTSLRLVINNHTANAPTTNGVIKPLELQPT
jgi:hypothetical protein